MIKTPCQASETPDDWFIGKDGRQYPDEEFVTEQDVINHLNQVDPDGTRTEDMIMSVWNRLTKEAKTARLAARRHAREKCQQCPARLRCGVLAIELDVLHGTWGGYYEEQIQEIRDEKKKRAKRHKQQRGE